MAASFSQRVNKKWQNLFFAQEKDSDDEEGDEEEEGEEGESKEVGEVVKGKMSHQTEGDDSPTVEDQTPGPKSDAAKEQRGHLCLEKVS